MPGTREDWFPTSIWFFDHPDPAALNATLLQTILAERDRDRAGMPGRSNIYGWHSGDDLHRRAELRDLLGFIDSGVTEVAQYLCWDLSRFRPALLNCWAIINGKGASNKVHNHPSCFLSGVYYVQAPEGCGDLFFLDPRSVAVMMALPITRPTPSTFQQVVYKPRPGRLLLFPSWLHHGVEPNESDQERVCVSFNIGAHWFTRAAGPE